MIFIGWDKKDEIAAAVCASSIRRRSNHPIRYLKLTDPDVAKVYDRKFYMRGNQPYDYCDEKPFSTEFSFSRFLVPYLMNYEGWALFADADIVFLSSIDDLFALADDRYAVSVVKHNHKPENIHKMGGLVQTEYQRKNWSSVCLWNCSHEANRTLTPIVANTSSGAWLHGFRWLKDDDIGELPKQWNHLVGHTPIENGKPIHALHYTDGAPTFKDYRDCEFSSQFWKEAGDYVWEGRDV